VLNQSSVNMKQKQTEIQSRIRAAVTKSEEAKATLQMTQSGGGSEASRLVYSYCIC
jgi:hypothetical protein